MNRNTKRYPQEEITSLKKRGKRLRGGYLLAKLKNWKSSGTKPEIDRPKTIKPKPLTTKRKTQPKQKVEAKGRAIPKSIEIKPVKAKKTIAKQPKQKVESKGRAIPKSIEIKLVKAKKTIAKQPKQKVEAKGRAIPKSIEVKPIEKKVRKPRQKSVNKIVVEKIKQAEQKPANVWLGALEIGNKEDKIIFKMQCGFCHQQGNAFTRMERSEEEWKEVISRMIGYGSRLPSDLQDKLPKVLETNYKKLRDHPALLAEPAAWNEHLSQTTITEWPIGDSMSQTHDMLISKNKLVYVCDNIQDRLYEINTDTNTKLDYRLWKTFGFRN
jgi:hypothetical protein